jgi:hypothetical protein
LERDGKRDKGAEGDKMRGVAWGELGLTKDMGYEQVYVRGYWE